MKASTKIALFLGGGMALLATIGAGIAAHRKATQKQEVMNLLFLQARASETYHGADRNSAKQALENALAETGKLPLTLRRVAEQIPGEQHGLFEFEWALQWLQLASIYDSEGRHSEAETAMDNAILHMDEYRRLTGRSIPNWNDPSLRSDELRAILRKAEQDNPPRWKAEALKGK